MTDFNRLIAENNRIIETRLNEQLGRINTPEKLSDYLKGTHKIYKKNPEKHIKTSLTKRADKEKETDRQDIISIENAPDFSGEFIITVEWKRSKMWGSNPKAFTNKGFKGSSIGGCGYDKLSTATAQALNSNKSILKLLYKKKNNNLEKHNHELLGYGSGYDLLPAFEGGVGVGSHQQIINNIGLKMVTITSTPNVDVFLIKPLNELV